MLVIYNKDGVRFYVEAVCVNVRKKRFVVVFPSLVKRSMGLGTGWTHDEATKAIDAQLWSEVDGLPVSQPTIDLTHIQKPYPKPQAFAIPSKDTARF